MLHWSVQCVVVVVVFLLVNMSQCVDVSIGIVLIATELVRYDWWIVLARATEGCLMEVTRHSREHTPDRRALRQIKRLFVLAGVIEAEGCCTVNAAADLFRKRSSEAVSDRQIRRDLILLAELGVLEETKSEIGGRMVFRYSFEGWPIAVH